MITIIICKFHLDNSQKITYFAPIENDVFIDYQYFTIEKDGLFFYIQNRYFGGYQITTYKKINFILEPLLYGEFLKSLILLF